MTFITIPHSFAEDCKRAKRTHYCKAYLITLDITNSPETRNHNEKVSTKCGTTHVQYSQQVRICCDN